MIEPSRISDCSSSGASKRLDLAQGLVSRHIREVRFGRPREQQHIFDDSFQAVDFVGDDFGILKFGVPGCRCFC